MSEASAGVETSHDSYEDQEPMSAIPAMAASDYSPDRYKNRKKRMSTGKKVALSIVIVLVVALACGGTAVAFWYNNIANNIRGDQDITTLAAPAADEPYYVLLMGSDNREGWEEITDQNDGERTDSIMLARVDEKEKSVSLISIPRDIRVNAGSHGYCKINALIGYGGYDLLISTLNEMFGIKINYYAKIYFLDFLKLVDTLGGVTVEVPEGTASPEGVFVPVGDAVRLNGEQALILARCRHGIPVDQGVYAAGDFQRTLNQRNLIKAIAKEAMQQDATALPGLVQSLSECVETNMSLDRLIALAVNMRGMDVESMQTTQLPIGATTAVGDWEAVIYKDVFEVLCLNLKNGDDLFKNMDNYSYIHNDVNVGDDYTDGPVYAYAIYANLYGSPFSEGYTPPASITSGSGSSKSSGSSSKGSSGSRSTSKNSSSNN